MRNVKTCTARYALPVLLWLALLSSCKIRKDKNIVYYKSKDDKEYKLDVYSRRMNSSKNVIIFIHGGNWDSGSKWQYDFLGKRFARKGATGVIIGYPLSPSANNREQVAAAAYAVKWVQDNIERYGGDPRRVFISGHSAGGQIAAVLAADALWLKSAGALYPLNGAVLIDAAGLDMYGYLLERKLDSTHTYIRTFGSDPLLWKEASALYQVHRSMSPMLIYRGGDTMESIATSNDKFAEALRGLNVTVDYRVLPGKKHIPMITQFLRGRSPRYAEIMEFMGRRYN
jgi:acetyl esterase/lipase